MESRQHRAKRQFRIRKKISGTGDRPRLAVFRSNKYIYAQVIDDKSGQTLAAASSVKAKTGNKKVEQAYQVGKELAVKSIKAGIKKVVFDRGGFLYHGRVAAVAKGAREGGLEF